jgi:RNA polymerase sigma-70 factor (ECF subfamily)
LTSSFALALDGTTSALLPARTRAAPRVRRERASSDGASLAPRAMPAPAATDEALCAAVARGDERAVATLMERWKGRMFAVLLRSTGGRAPEAEDLFQELWMRVVRAAPDFDPRLRFGTWLYRIAVNLTRDAARRRAASGFAEVTRDGALPEGADEAPRPDDRLAGAEAAGELRRAIAALPEGQREVLVLRYLEELPEAEVAAAAGIPAGTVKSRLHHAVRALRRALAPLQEEER